MWQKKRGEKCWHVQKKKKPLKPHLRHHAPRMLPIFSVCESFVNWKKEQRRLRMKQRDNKSIITKTCFVLLLILLAMCCLVAVPCWQTEHMNVKKKRMQNLPWWQGLEKATAAAPRSSSSSSSDLESPCWLGDSSTTKPPEVLEWGSAPRISITWLLTSDILLRTSAIWALRRIRTPESGVERRTAWGRRSRSFLEWDCAARGKKETMCYDNRTNLFWVFFPWAKTAWSFNQDEGEAVLLCLY